MNHKEQRQQAWSMAYYKNSRYLGLGMAFILLGAINCVIGYMYLPDLWARTISSSTILVLLGLGILIVYEEKLKNMQRIMRT